MGPTKRRHETAEPPPSAGLVGRWFLFLFFIYIATLPWIAWSQFERVALALVTASRGIRDNSMSLIQEL